MVKSILSRVKDTSDVTLDVQLIKERLITRPDNDRLFELFCAQKHGSSQNFVTVERVRMSADKLEVLSYRLLEEIVRELIFVFGSHHLKLGRDNRIVVVHIDELFGLLSCLHFNN